MHRHLVVWVDQIFWFCGSGLFQSSLLSQALKVSAKKAVGLEFSLLPAEEIYSSLSWIKSLPGFGSFSGKSSWIVDDVLPIAIDCQHWRMLSNFVWKMYLSHIDKSICLKLQNVFHSNCNWLPPLENAFKLCLQASKPSAWSPCQGCKMSIHDTEEIQKLVFTTRQKFHAIGYFLHLPWNFATLDRAHHLSHRYAKLNLRSFK